MEKRGLGRGLSALISHTLTEESRAQVQEIPTEQVVANPYQPRTLFDPLKMEELVTSIKEHGVLQPVLVRRVGHERFQLVAGERRFRAAQRAGLRAVPALIKECTERELLEIALVENVQREDIGMMEAARAYRRMINEFGMTQEAIAQRVGKSRPAITNTLRLLNLPEPVQDSLERGEITEGHGRALMAAEDANVIIHAWQSVVKRHLSVRDTTKLVQELRARVLNSSGGETPAPDGRPRDGRLSEGPRAADPNEAAIADRLQQALGTKVTLRHSSGGTGKIEIEFYSVEELDRLVELLLHGGQ